MSDAELTALLQRGLACIFAMIGVAIHQWRMTPMASGLSDWRDFAVGVLGWFFVFLAMRLWP
jgi:hypothetical protein